MTVLHWFFNLFIWILCVPCVFGVASVAAMFLAQFIIERYRLSEPESTWVLLIAIPLVGAPAVYGGVVVMKMII